VGARSDRPNRHAGQTPDVEQLPPVPVERRRPGAVGEGERRHAGAPRAQQRDQAVEGGLHQQPDRLDWLAEAHGTFDPERFDPSWATERLSGIDLS